MCHPKGRLGRFGSDSAQRQGVSRRVSHPACDRPQGVLGKFFESLGGHADVGECETYGLKCNQRLTELVAGAHMVTRVRKSGLQHSKQSPRSQCQDQREDLAPDPKDNLWYLVATATGSTIYPYRDFTKAFELNL